MTPLRRADHHHHHRHQRRAGAVGRTVRHRQLGGTIEELGQTGSNNLDTVAGRLWFTDADLSDKTHTASVTGVLASGATAGLPDAATLQGLLHDGGEHRLQQRHGGLDVCRR